MAKNRRGGQRRRIPVEPLDPKPTKPGSVVLRALTAETGRERESSKGTANAKRSGGLLSTIFRDDRGRPIDMTRLDRGPKRRMGPWRILLVLAVLAAASVAGLFVFNRPAKFGNAEVSITLAAAPTVASGAPFTLTVTVENGEAVALEDAELTLQYPEGFRYSQADPKPENDAHQAWRLGTLAPGASKAVSISGAVLGSVGAVETFVATASYIPANFSSEFTKTASVTVTVNASRLELAIDGPPSVVPGKSFPFTVTVTNAATEALDRVVVTGDFPDSFALDSAEPKATEANRWALGRLEPNQKATISVTGSLTGDAGGSAQLTWRVSLTGADGAETPQSETNQIVLLVNPTVTLSVSVNDSSTDGTVALGDTLNVKVAFTNASDLDLPHASLAVTVDGRVVDFSTLADPAGGRRNGSTLTWTESQVPALSDLKPGDSGLVSFSVGTLPTITVQTASDRTIAIRVSASLTASGKTEPTATTGVTRMVLTRAAIGAEARYTTEDGETVGEGPLPPRAGSSTTYRIFWTLANTTNDVKDVVVTAIVPSGVQFTGKNVTTSSGTLTFNPASRTVRWTLGRLPAGSGTLVANQAAAFSVSITPTESEVGGQPELLGATALTGTDAFTGTAATASANALTTAASTDPTATGKGTVVSATNANG